MLESSQYDELGEIHVALGALGVFLVVVPLGGIVPEILPARLGEPDWRFGALGYFLDALTLPSVGLVICLVAAALRQSIRGSRLTAGVALVIAVGAAIALPVFLREGMVLAGSAPDQRVAPVFERAMQKTGLVALFALPCLVLTGIAGLRQGRKFERTVVDPKSSLVV